MLRRRTRHQIFGLSACDCGTLCTGCTGWFTCFGRSLSAPSHRPLFFRIKVTNVPFLQSVKHENSEWTKHLAQYVRFEAHPKNTWLSIVVAVGNNCSGSLSATTGVCFHRLRWEENRAGTMWPSRPSCPNYTHTQLKLRATDFTEEVVETTSEANNLLVIVSYFIRTGHYSS